MAVQKTISITPLTHRKLVRVRKLGRYGTYMNTIDILLDRELERLARKDSLPPRAVAA